MATISELFPWLDNISAYGPSTLTARTCNSGIGSSCSGTIGDDERSDQGKLTAISANGKFAFVRLAPDADGKFRVSSLQLYRLLNIPEGHCIVPGR